MAQLNEKGLVNDDQPLENLVELRGIEPLTPRLPEATQAIRNHSPPLLFLDFSYT
jgi:hypothetical protein